MNKQKLIILIIAAVGAISTFLPWANVTFLGTISVNGTNGGDGWITLILFAIAGIISLVGDKMKPLSNTYKIITIVAGLAAAAVGIINIVNIKSELSKVSEQNFLGEQLQNIVSIGFGLWLIVICGIALAVVTYLMKEKNKEDVKTNTIENQ